MSVVTEKRLRAVRPDETRPVPTSISEAVSSGSGRDVLAAMRRQLAKKLDDGEVSSNSFASSYKELRELDRLIRSADAAADAEFDAEAEKNGRTGEGRRSFKASAI